MKTISNKEWQYRLYDQLEKKVLGMPHNTGTGEELRNHCYFLLSLYRDCLEDMTCELSFKIMEDIYSQIKKIESLG